ncbi:pilus assembly FimT family protein [Rubrobacter aplysinae]|uniref:pilus assembly FimT family protein n=1 Tax=Rubrobacter aplysinae TaxID=909625 RepID=UPI00064C00CD|nr:prepilin-type N-terminal cleavage/methylation domain-containing protein [Rubrobacter aplysinae]
MRLRLRNQFRRARGERGFTLPEVLTTIAILGILIAIAMSLWNSVIESRRVDSAANQLASDLRLAHTKATNQLTDWRVVLVKDREGEQHGPDYYLIKLKEPYNEDSGGTPQPEDSGKFIARTFPGDVKAVQTYDDQGDADYSTGYVDPEPNGSATSTLSFEFNSDGSAWTYPGVSGSACVTVDGDPELKTTVLSATSRVKVKDEDC